MKNRIYIIGIIACMLLVAVASVGYVAYTAIMAPIVQGEQTVYIQVRPEDKTTSILDKLTSVADFKSTTGFTPLMKHYKYDSHIKPGNYAIRPGDSMRDICLRLLSGNQTPVKLVVPSVRTLDRLAGAVARQLMTDSASIARFLTDQHLIDSLGYTTETFPTLFIPNTYEVYWTMTPEQFINRMTKEHSRFWNTDRLAKAKAQGLTPEQVCTLASIVDEETNKNDEKPMVAGLYLNRLHRGILLQADPTVKFAHGKFDLRRILLTHLTIDSPYNTYKYAGLPPGPIRIPSIAGIESVLNPAKHNYIYMCAKEDFSGYHNFATTLSQHNANARRYQQALNSRGIK
ncbi:MAG: endolytic transglycosylase MltG [Bacteroidaceae bacterium]|nr:endolytic transglycosylase MltG [Bacteroidaceae bacterium]